MYGRGRGRGRGRGGRSFAAPRNDSGDESAPELLGPPPLYPDIDLPEVPDLSEEDKQLLAFWRNLGHFYKNSCYHLEPADATKGKIKDDPYSAMSKSKAQTARAPLSSVLTLDSHYFPEELFSTVEKRAAASASSTAFLPVGRMPTKVSAAIFERFANLESGAGDGKHAAGGGAEGREDGGKEGGDEDDEDEQQLEEEDEELQDDDDYLMGEAYDDDEGYDEDPYNDGDNEGPIY